MFLAVIIILFLSTGAIVDYWQASMEHKYKLPSFIKNYFGIFWLVLYTGIFPFLIAFCASGYNLKTAQLYLGVFILGTVIWDLIYSYLYSGKLFSDQPGYFYLKGKNFGLSKIQMYLWGVIRIICPC